MANTPSFRRKNSRTAITDIEKYSFIRFPLQHVVKCIIWTIAVKTLSPIQKTHFPEIHVHAFVMIPELKKKP